MIQIPTPEIITFFIYVGVLAFAIVGALKARTYEFDILGASVLAFVTAYGGGTLRDLLINKRPITWMNDDLVLILVFAGVIITFLFKSTIANYQRTIFIADAIGLGFFTVVGIERSFELNIIESYAIVMGVITATFGGLIADIFTNQMPSLLKRGELYATASAIGGVIYILLRRWGIDPTVNLFLCSAIVVAIRIISIRKKLMLPGI